MESDPDRRREDGLSAEPDPDDSQSAGLPGAAGHGEPAAPVDQQALEEAADRSPFPHPQWMVGVVLIFAVLFIAGGLGNPLWLLIGSPFILVLAVYIWVKLATRGKGDEG